MCCMGMTVPNPVARLGLTPSAMHLQCQEQALVNYFRGCFAQQPGHGCE